ncbi:hypothetical protein GCM10023189_60700 [Nibrella saemangeumensis]|uniref:histidine kinase n=1 Tax=Nibrella saemangeumensis TaxID=1084526 RepID=A0ABP8NTU0_9BACT
MSCLGQSNKAAIDSIQALLKNNPQADTNRVKLLFELGNLYRTQPKQRRAVAEDALKLSRKLRYRAGEGKALSIIAHTYRDESNFKQALAAGKQALQMATLLNDQTQLATVYELIGGIYYLQGNYAQGMEFLLQALKPAEKSNDEKLLGNILGDIGLVYLSLGDHDQALFYFLRSLKLTERSGSRNSLIKAINNTAEAYRLLGNNAKAIDMYSRALAVAREINNDFFLSLMESNLANLYEKQGKYAEVFPFAFRALAIARNIDDQEGVAFCSDILARAYLHTNRLDSARWYGLRALKVAQQTGLKEYSRDASQVLAEVYARSKDFGNAFQYQQLYMIYKDSLINENTTKKVALQQYNYDLAKKESRIALLIKDKNLQAQEAKRQRQLLYTIIVGLIIVIGFAVMVWRNSRIIQRANALLKRQKQEIDSQAQRLQVLNLELSEQKEEVEAQRDELEDTLTKLKATQAQLIQAEKMASLGELTAGIAHEIQNPLNFVNNFSSLSVQLLKELEDPLKALPESEREYADEILHDLTQNLQRINHHGGRADAIVKGMLQHSRTSAGKKELTDINALANEYLHLSYHGLQAKNDQFSADLRLHLDPNLNKVEVIPQDIGRVLLNLYNNAFYAVQHKQEQQLNGYHPKVEVYTQAEKGRIEIKVKDNGTGIPKEIINKIYQPFFTTKPTGEGTGLGLSLSYDIITKGHGGEMLVESEAGEYTEMIIRLPMEV